MSSEFTIISIDASRTQKKDYIRAELPWKEVAIDFVNGKDPASLAKAKNKWSAIDTPGPFKAGEFGIFYSVLNCAEYGAENNGILYFEDDAMLISGVHTRLEKYLNELPNNADIFALWSPFNQHYDYINVSNYNSKGEPIYDKHNGSIFDFGHAELCRLWQGYGNVSMYVTKQGCVKLINYISSKGFFSPIDCLICIGVHSGYLNGYSLKPEVPTLIDYDWNAETTIHNSRWGMIEDLIKENNEIQ